MGIGVKFLDSGEHSGKYVLTSFVSGESTDPLTRTQSVAFFHHRRMVDAKLDLIKDFFSFPHMFGDGMCGSLRDNSEGHDAWYAWFRAMMDADDGDAFLEEKYQEVITIIEQAKEKAEQAKEKAEQDEGLEQAKGQEAT